jgi:uncharacterized protein YjiS (DUF1127 family)
MSNRNLAVAAPQICSAGPLSSRSLVRQLGASLIAFLRTAPRRFAAWRRQRREREELRAFLASDHRIAADIGYRHQRP